MGGLLATKEEWETLAKNSDYNPMTMATVRLVSLRQLERHFKSAFDKTPTEWIRELRCRIALKLLRHGYSTKAVAAELKYANPSHFCHDFKKVYGCSPQTHFQRMKCRF